MIYYSTLLLLLIFSLINDKINLNKFFELFAFIFIASIIILRFQTGGDWSGYEQTSIGTINHHEPPTTNFLNILIYFTHGILKLDINIFFIPSIYFCILFFFFIKEFNNTYFLLIISFPFFIILLGMGYIKQGLSLVSFLFFINYNKNVLRYFFLIASIGFHPAIFALIFLYFLSKQSTLLKKKLPNYFLIFLFGLFILLFFFIFFDYIKNYFFSYIIQNEQYFSKGAIPRCLITLFSSILYLFLFYKKKIRINFKNNNFYKFCCYFCIVLFPLVFIYPTAVDRMYLFFIFLHLVSSHCLLLSLEKNYFFRIKYFLIFFFIFIFSFWDIFSVNSNNWNYNFFLF